MNDYADSDGVSGLDACCACGGGKDPEAPPTTRSPTIPTEMPTATPTISPTKPPTFQKLKRQILDAPYDGTPTTIIIDESYIIWEEEIQIQETQNILLLGKQLSQTEEAPILDAKGNGRHFYVDGTLSAENIIFQNGASYDGDSSNGRRGGSIYLNYFTSTSLTNCIFRNNMARYGGAIYTNYRSPLAITGTVFENNFALVNGGAIHFHETEVNVVISNTTFVGNEAARQNNNGNGGALYFKDISGTVTIKESTFENCRATSHGGAIFYSTAVAISSPEFILRDNAFESNAAKKGGAIYSEGFDTIPHSIDLIENCFFNNNQAISVDGYQWEGQGGAIYNKGIIKALSFSEFSNNKASDEGPDIYVYNCENTGDTSTVIRDASFYTQEVDERPRVFGPILRCGDDTPTISVCPTSRAICIDTKRSDSDYGVKCGQSCSMGSYGLGPHNCVQCSEGKYAVQQSQHQSEACQLCPKGRSNPLQGQIGVEKCLPCEEGKYSGMGAPQCLKVCLRGQEQISVDKCKSCPAGKTSNESKTPSCVNCPIGSIAAKEESPYCEKCEVGTRSKRRSHNM